jgi:hypothetical protein
MAAYGFSADDDVLTQLFALNQDIAADSATARGPGADGRVGARISNYRLLSMSSRAAQHAECGEGPALQEMPWRGENEF